MWSEVKLLTSAPCIKVATTVASTTRPWSFNGSRKRNSWRFSFPHTFPAAFMRSLASRRPPPSMSTHAPSKRTLRSIAAAHGCADFERRRRCACGGVTSRTKLSHKPARMYSVFPGWRSSPLPARTAANKELVSCKSGSVVAAEVSSAKPRVRSRYSPSPRSESAHVAKAPEERAHKPTPSRRAS